MTDFQGVQYPTKAVDRRLIGAASLYAGGLRGDARNKLDDICDRFERGNPLTDGDREFLRGLVPVVPPGHRSV